MKVGKFLYTVTGTQLALRFGKAHLPLTINQDIA